MRKLFVAACILLAACTTQAQTGNARYSGRTSFFAEGGGPSIAFAANIDTRFKKTHLGLGGRIGVGFVTAYQTDTYDPVSGGYIWGEQKSALTLPVQLNYIFGKQFSPHTFEVGAGLTYVSDKLSILNFYDEDASQLFGSFSFMYRRQPMDGGFSWRAGFTPLVAKSYIQPFGALSIGYNF